MDKIPASSKNITIHFGYSCSTATVDLKGNSGKRKEEVERLPRRAKIYVNSYAMASRISFVLTAYSPALASL